MPPLGVRLHHRDAAVVRVVATDPCDPARGNTAQIDCRSRLCPLARVWSQAVCIRKPVLLLPEGITDRLTPAQLEAVLAHQLCHVRRRDNLTGAIHMVVEAAFWFHPLVWWIGSRLVDEAEQAAMRRCCGRKEPESTRIAPGM